MQFIIIYNYIIIVLLSYNIYTQYIDRLSNHLNQYKLPVNSYTVDSNHLSKRLSSLSSKEVMKLISGEYDRISSSSSSISSIYKQTKIPKKLSNLHDQFYYDDASILSTSNSLMPTNDHVVNSRTDDISNNDLHASHLWNKEYEIDQYKPSLIQQSTSKLIKLPDSSASFHPLTAYAYVPQKNYNQTVLNYHNERQLKRKKQSLKSKPQQQQQQSQQLVHEVKVGGNVSNGRKGESQFKGRW
ncbi:hypothetical protein MN116_008646, partial [Schistosoma mekongi]